MQYIAAKRSAAFCALLVIMIFMMGFAHAATRPVLNALSVVSAEPMARVTLTGTGFGAMQGVGKVYLGTSQAAVISWSDTKIVAAVAVGSKSGTARVYRNGGYSNTLAFAVIDPRIVTLSVTSAEPGQQVSITGVGFGATQGVGKVYLGTSQAAVVSWSDTEIVATVAVGSKTGSAKVIQFNSTSNTLNFSIIYASIQSVTPNYGEVGDQVTISGAGFGATQGAGKLYFGSKLAEIVSWSDAQIVANAPDGARSGSVHVMQYGEQSNSVDFTIVEPKITSIAPTSVEPEQQVTITGVGFSAAQGSGEVHIGSMLATIISWSDTKIIVAVTDGVNGGAVRVKQHSVWSNSVDVKVVKPYVDAVSPTKAEPGQSVIITGSGFGDAQGSGVVMIGGLAATIVNWSDTKIVATIAYEAKSGAVYVEQHGFKSNQRAFTIIPLWISSIAPSAGVVGSSVTIAGSGFGALQRKSAISFNGVAATPTSWSNTQIVAAVPSGANSGPITVTVGANAASSTNFTVNHPPVVSSMSPTSGLVGASVTLTGSNFGATQGASAVTLNGVAASIVSWSDSSITALAPVGATSGAVIVTVNGLSRAAGVFNVLYPPVIASLTPAAAIAGASVVIAGTNFGSTQGTNTVFFNGVAATVANWSDTQIVITVPAGATSGVVTVNANGLASNGANLVVYQRPVVSSFAPTSAIAGASVTITGANFGATQGASSVTINGVAAITTSWSDTSITATVPTVATSGQISVTANTLTGQSSSALTIYQTPIVSSFLPTSAVAGASVTIAGVNFGATQGASAISFNGVVATVTIWSDTQIVTTVPTNATSGVISVTANTVTGQSTSAFTVLDPPTISSLSQSSAVAGASVVITGTNFGAAQNSSTVAFNGVVATVTSWSDTSISATVPTTASTGNIIVIVNGLASNGVGFTVVVPTIGSVSPVVGVAGMTVTLTGTNFGIAQGAVAFNGIAATITSWSDTSISAVVPNGATTGVVTIQLLTAVAQGPVFTIESGATVSSILPTSGQAGSSVVISGVNFGSSQGANSISFNGTAAIVLSWSDAQIAVTVPDSASSGLVAIQIGSTTTAGPVFTVIPPPTINSISPTTGTVGSSIIITGANFGATQGASKVTFVGVSTSGNTTQQYVLPATPTLWSDTKIVVPVPVNAVTGAITITVGVDSVQSPIFTVIPSPIITAVTPPVGQAGDTVTISGSNFGTTRGAGRVDFNGATGMVSTWSDTSISVIVPRMATTGNLAVYANARASNSVIFTIPTLTGSLTESFTAVGSNVINLTEQGSADWISFANTDYDHQGPIRKANVVSQISQAVASGDSHFEAFFSGMGHFTYTDGTPSTAGGPVDPNYVYEGPTGGNVQISVAAGTTPRTLHLYATGYGPNVLTATLSDNSSPAISATSWSGLTDFSITFNAASPGQALLINIQSYTLFLHAATLSGLPDLMVPKILSVSPQHGVSGDRISILGQGFGATRGDSKLTLNGQDVPLVSWSASEIEAFAPEGVTSGPVQISAAWGVSNPDYIFTVDPLVSAVTPASGAVGSIVTISGSGFGLPVGTVSFNGVQATVQQWSDSQIVAIVPNGTSTGPIIVFRSDASRLGPVFTVISGEKSPFLKSRVQDTPDNVNLSEYANTDWYFYAGPIRKALSGGTVGDSTVPFGWVKYQWNDGISETSSDTVCQNCVDLIQVVNTSTSVSVTAPAGIQPQTLQVRTYSYGAVSMSASLSDGSVAPITDNSVVCSPSGGVEKTYLIDFRSASDGQTVTVRFDTQNSVTLESVTLQPDGSPISATGGELVSGDL